MRKTLSLNGKPKNTNRANSQRDWSSVTHERSFSKVVAAIGKYAPRGKTIEEQQEALIRNIKKLKRRIDKAKHFCNVPITRETKDQAEYRAKIQRWEALLNKQVFTLRYLQEDYDRISLREKTKFENRQEKENQTVVGLENGKTAPKVVKALNMFDRIKPGKSGKFIPEVIDHKKSTSKTKVYKQHNPSNTAWDKAEQEWKNLVAKKGKDYDLNN